MFKKLALLSFCSILSLFLVVAGLGNVVPFLFNSNSLMLQFIGACLIPLIVGAAVIILLEGRSRV